MPAAKTTAQLSNLAIAKRKLADARKTLRQKEIEIDSVYTRISNLRGQVGMDGELQRASDKARYLQLEAVDLEHAVALAQAEVEDAKVCAAAALAEDHDVAISIQL